MLFKFIPSHLVRVQPKVDAFPCKELWVCTHLGNSPTLDHHNAVGIVDCGKPVCYDNACAATASIVKCLLNDPLMFGVKGWCGLIQQQQFGGPDKCTGNGYLLLLSSTQVGTFVTYIGIVALYAR